MSRFLGAKIPYRGRREHEGCSRGGRDRLGDSPAQPCPSREGPSVPRVPSVQNRTPPQARGPSPLRERGHRVMRFAEKFHHPPNFTQRSEDGPTTQPTALSHNTLLGGQETTRGTRGKGGPQGRRPRLYRRRDFSETTVFPTCHVSGAGGAVLTKPRTVTPLAAPSSDCCTINMNLLCRRRAGLDPAGAPSPRTAPERGSEEPKRIIRKPHRDPVAQGFEKTPGVGGSLSNRLSFSLKKYLY